MIKTILLTGTISISGQSEHKQRNTNDRLQQYIANLLKYIIDSPFEIIIFGENSGYNIDKERESLHNLASIFNKKIELLQFVGNHEKTIELGRGYGESEIMEYAITHSKLLNNEDAFVKITGRYLLTNTFEFARDNNKNNMFIRMTPGKPRCNTACYVTTPQFYKSHLRSIGSKVNDNMGKDKQLEGVFYKELKKIKKNFSSLRVLPKLLATTGSGYTLKPNILIDTTKNILLSLGLYTI